MFYHTELLLKVLFAKLGRGPGGWIRLLTFYRMYDAVGVLVKCTLPLLLFIEPRLLLAFIMLSYLVLSVKLIFYHAMYGIQFLRGGWGLFTGFALFPAYEYLIWISRLSAFPRAMIMRGRKLSLLGEFGDYFSEQLQPFEKPFSHIRIHL